MNYETGTSKTASDMVEAYRQIAAIMGGQLRQRPAKNPRHLALGIYLFA